MIVLAPGKLLVTGAYAVLEGAPALVVAVDRHARATESGVDTSALYDGERKLGLGSSAAWIVARLGREAAERGDDLAGAGVRARLLGDALAEHAAAQGGGSGVDVAAAVYGGALAYTRGAVPEAVSLPDGAALEAFFSGASARTSDMRARAGALRGRDPARHAAHMRVLEAASRRAILACHQNDPVALVAAARDTERALAALGADADAPIVPPTFAELARAAERERAAFLPSGAGGGDVGVFVGLAAPSTVFCELARTLGMTPLGVAVDHGGVRTIEETMKRTSRLPGFYKVTVAERRALVSDATGADAADMERALDMGGLDADTADKFVENVIGTYALPYGVALNVRVNGKDCVVPMVVEEPSVVAAASNAAKMVRAGGGFAGEADEPLMISQIQLTDVADPVVATQAILRHKAEILAAADRAIPGLTARGGGARDLEVRTLGEWSDRMLVVHVIVDCRDAMGANLVNSIAEGVADRLAALAGGKVGLRILSNLCDKRCVRVTCRVPATLLATDDMDGEAVIDGIVNASRFAELDPYRAATHNKGIMNGVDAVVIATGNDWRAVEAGAHAFAARTGRYQPLATWRRDGGALVGRIELPLALGTVGGTLRVHPAARLSLRMIGTDSATELAMVAASVGLASNLAAVRALATDGIQRGHMALHARAVAVAAGAAGALVERVAAMIVEARDITVESARRALQALSIDGDGATAVDD
jgi:hydroxymethylglutaryl-CoA reductase